jgi:RNA recognition motif-containing protein
VSGLPKGCTDDQLKEIFSRYGTVQSMKVLPPRPSKDDIAGIVSMDSEAKAKWCVENVNGTVPQGLAGPIEVKQKTAGWGGKGWDEPPNDTIYVTGLPSGYGDEQVQAIFSKYGPVKSCKVLPAQPDKPDVAAIVSMESPEQAKTLIANVSGTVPDGLSEPITIKAKLSKNWGNKGWGKGGFMYGGGDPWSMMQMLYMKGSAGFPAKGKGKGWGWGGPSGLSAFPAEKKVWVGDVPEDVTFRDLLEHFGGSGKAKFATVMRGKGAGTGGVSFGTAEEATEAIQTLNGSSLKGSTIVVDVWTKKSEVVETQSL